VHWQKITLVGVGLLGGSLGLALRRRGLASRVTGYVRRAASIAECIEAGAVDDAGTDLAAAVTDADLVVLGTPIAQMAELTAALAPSLKPGALVTDVGSVKAEVVTALEPLVAAAGGGAGPVNARGHGAVFIGSHPMAGGEKMGVKAARPDLFEGAVCVVTPSPGADPARVRQVEDLWRSVGGRPLRMTAELHDDLVSRSSHLPHVVAAELANYVLSPVHPKEQGVLCASGFRDTTRIASGSPEMWRDICMANRRNLARVLGVFIEDLQEFQHALENGDSRTVAEFFDEAKARRDAWCARSSASSTSPE
jgi:prephenate dehydrogenase